MKGAVVLATHTLLAVSTATATSRSCPFSDAQGSLGYIAGYDAHAAEEYVNAVKDLDWNAVKRDIKTMLTTSEAFWPADYGNYGPFMIRQAWHCAGSYRRSDGRGGCDGGRQRFDPERSWDDNTNLDKAKSLIWPIKKKYGVGLSWGDLIILTADVAIEAMGGPVLGFCGGRVDDADGSWSTLLGPSAEQEAEFPCAVNGQCTSPLGTTTVGLIYVNPEGPMGQPLPEKSAPQVRDTFARMNMNDTETVALIGGGHAFGKAHGACPKGAGPSPKEDPANPWPGLCGTGKGADAATSGFEGPWSTKPTQWTNNYFTELVGNTWEVEVGPGGKHQWKTVNGTEGIMMLTSDISLLHDAEYTKIAATFAKDKAALDKAFSHAWYKLTTRDMGPITRCLGPFVPAVQPFQYPLPEVKVVPTAEDLVAVRAAIFNAINTASSLLPPDAAEGKAYYGAIFTQLAYQCASTFRVSDYLGGCNGARIRLAPQNSWHFNTALDKALGILGAVKSQFDSLISWSDLIVLAGNVAIETAGGKPMAFCAGRADASENDVNGWESLSPNGNYSATISEVREYVRLLSLTNREYVALSARLRSPLQMARYGYAKGSFTTNIATLSNQYFEALLGDEWQVDGNGYKAAGKDLFMTNTDLLLKYEADYLAIVQEFASDNDAFLDAFAAAWTKLMNLDRFDGPIGNVCTSGAAPTPSPPPAPTPPSSNPYVVAGATFAATAALAAIAYFVVLRKSDANVPHPGSNGNDVYQKI